jgi:hypothetical protein
MNETRRSVRPRRLHCRRGAGQLLAPDELGTERCSTRQVNSSSLIRPRNCHAVLRARAGHSEEVCAVVAGCANGSALKRSASKHCQSRSKHLENLRQVLETARSDVLDEVISRVVAPEDPPNGIGDRQLMAQSGRWLKPRCPKSAEVPILLQKSKIERTTLKISRKPMFRRLYCCNGR